VHIQPRKLLATCITLLALPLGASAATASVTPKKHYHASVKSSSGTHSKTARASHHHVSVPAEMPSERAKEIQSALIKQGYMTGEPTGKWDTQTISAMQKLQGDNGWQTKITPDSRALIKLGLGPTPHDDTLNHASDLTQTASQTSPQASAQTGTQ
jgi:hypothetical protein